MASNELRRYLDYYYLFTIKMSPSSYFYIIPGWIGSAVLTFNLIQRNKRN